MILSLILFKDTKHVINYKFIIILNILKINESCIFNYNYKFINLILWKLVFSRLLRSSSIHSWNSKI